MSDLFDVSVIVTSFLRFGYLYECLREISNNLPECSVIVADDSGPSESMSRPMVGCGISVSMESGRWRRWAELPFDSGLSAKRNAAVALAPTKYCLLGCDDFDFSTKGAREGILDMLAVIDDYAINDEGEKTNPVWDVVGGRVDGRPYEGFLEYVPGSHIKETRLENPNGLDFLACDLTINYFLARTEVLRQFPWDENIGPIGGEHGDFFLTLKENRRKVAWVKGVNITTLKLGPEAQHPDYPKYRARAVTHGHRKFLEKRNIKQYIGF